MPLRVLLAVLFLVGCGGGHIAEPKDEPSSGASCAQDSDCPAKYRCGASSVCEALPQDLTPPMVVSKSPDCHPNCWVGETLTLEMSEPVRLSGGAVPVSFSKAVASYKVRLLEDQKTIQVSFEGLTAPNTVSVSLTGVTDLYGNPAGDAPIEYGYPVWASLYGPRVTTAGADTGVLSIVELPTGEPVVAWQQDEGYSNSPLYGSRLLNSGVWERMATLNADTVNSVSWPFIASRGDDLVATWIESRAVRVAKVTATGRELLGTPVNSDGFVDDPPVVAIDSEGRPVVAWRQSGIRAARWSGTAWEPLGTSVSEGTDTASQVALAMAPDGRPCAAYRSSGTAGTTLRVRCFADGVWSALGGDIAAANSLSVGPRALAFDASGGAYLAFHDRFLQQMAELSGGTWQVTTLSESPNSDPPAMAVDATLGPIASFCSSRAMGLVQRTAEGWTQTPQYSIGSSPFDIGSCDLVTGATGPWIVWNAISSGSIMRLQRYNR